MNPQKDPQYTNDFKTNRYSEKQIRNFRENFPQRINRNYWVNVFTYQKLSYEFIEEFIDKIDLYTLLVNQYISEKIMKDIFSNNKSYSYYVLRFQNVPEYLLIENIDNFDVGTLKINSIISKDVKKRVMDLKKVLENS